jgi:hypothetical protein
MYEMITGKTPYDGDSPVAVALGHINGGAPRPSSICPNIPKGLEQIIMKAMAHDLPDRYINAAALLQDLEAFRHDPTITFSNMPQSPQMERRAPLYVHQSEVALDFSQEKTETARQSANWGTSRTTVPEDRQEDEDDSVKGRASTIAVVICSLVAILAIIIFMILLTQNDINAMEPPTGSARLPQPQTTKETVCQSSVTVTTQDQTQQAVTIVATRTTRVQMPEVVGLPCEEAREILAQLGFSDVQIRQQESTLPAGTVLGQSAEPQIMVNVDTTVVLTCASGTVSKKCTFDMPFRTEGYYLTILLDGRPVVAEQWIEPYRATVTFLFAGKGRQTCQLFIDGELYNTLVVDFDAYAG